MEKHFENKHCVKPSQFKVGDHVLVKQEKKDKLTPPTPFLHFKLSVFVFLQYCISGDLIVKSGSFVLLFLPNRISPGDISVVA
jgi:hypothetical protein